MRSALSFATSLAIASYLASPVLAYEYNVGVGSESHRYQTGAVDEPRCGA